MNNLNKNNFAIVIFGVYILCFSAIAIRQGQTPSDLWSMAKIG